MRHERSWVCVYFHSAFASLILYKFHLIGSQAKQRKIDNAKEGNLTLKGLIISGRRYRDILKIFNSYSWRPLTETSRGLDP